MVAIGLVVAGAPHAAQLESLDIDGFKLIKFGDSLAQVKILPTFECIDVGLFQPAGSDIDPVSCSSSKQSLFGMKADVHVGFRQNKVIAIVLTVKDERPIDLTTAYARVYGKPRFVVWTNDKGIAVKTTYWLSKTGASISFTSGVGESPSMRTDFNGKTEYLHSAAYLDAAGTRLRLKGAVTPERDY